ncbi:hypothetical protein Tco_0235293, partial [Tanacetum coccineum]
EVEVAEAICLRGQIATVKAAEAARASELDGLKERNAALKGQVAALESATLSCDELAAPLIKVCRTGWWSVLIMGRPKGVLLMLLLITLRAVDFPLLAQLESQKDASIVDIMGLYHLEGPAAETLEANQLQPYPEQLMLPIHRDAASRLLSLSDVMVPLIEPLSAENLVGKASTSR